MSDTKAPRFYVVNEVRYDHDHNETLFPSAVVPYDSPLGRKIAAGPLHVSDPKAFAVIFPELAGEIDMLEADAVEFADDAPLYTEVAERAPTVWFAFYDNHAGTAAQKNPKYNRMFVEGADRAHCIQRFRRHYRTGGLAFQTRFIDPTASTPGHGQDFAIVQIDTPEQHERDTPQTGTYPI